MTRATKLRAVGLTAVASLVAVGAAACSGPAETNDDKPFAGQTLTVMNWQEYGSDLDWVIEEFEEQTGATVVHQYKNSDQGAIQMLQSGGLGVIDVAVVNHAYLTTMIEDGLLQPIDTSAVAAYDEVMPALVQVPSLTYDGDIYGVPWLWGVTSLAFDPEQVPSGTDSWSVLWDGEYAGRIAFFDDPQTAIETAAAYLGDDPADPDLDAVRTALMDLKSDLRLLWASANDWTRAFSTGQAVIGNAWSSLPSQVPSPTIELTIPEEGAVGWLDSWTIVDEAPHPELAEAWIDFMTSTDFQSRFVEDTTGQVAIPANATSAGLPVVTTMGVTADDLDRVDFVIITSEQLEEWTRLWEEVKAS